MTRIIKKVYALHWQQLIAGLLVPLLTLTSGCTSKQLVVSADFPAPLVEQLPHTLGLYFDDSFRNYQHQEESKDRPDWSITTGPAQVDLFTAVMPRLFRAAPIVSQLPDATHPATTDLVLQPKVSDFQFAIPRETKFKVYEVWIKYQLAVVDARGNLVAEWMAAAYGKTPTLFMQDDEDAMNAAIEVALRDLGANLSITLPRIPELKQWLATRQRSTTESLEQNTKLEPTTISRRKSDSGT